MDCNNPAPAPAPTLGTDAACVESLVSYYRPAIFRHSEKMNNKPRSQRSDEGLLFATLVEFVKCWGSGKRSRLFVESVNKEAFLNFSTFLGNPGKGHFRQNKMASGEETQGYPESPKTTLLGNPGERQFKQKKMSGNNTQGYPESSESTFLGNPGRSHFKQNKMASEDGTQGYPKSPKSVHKSKKKSNKKTERDNQRAANFQKRKREELIVAAAATGSSSPSVAVASTPNKEFEFSKPTCEHERLR